MPGPANHPQKGNGRRNERRRGWPAPIDTKATLLYVLVWAIVATMSESGLLHQAERLEVDTMLLMTAAQAPQAPVVVVTIDEATFEELNLMYPFPRSVHAQLIDRLNQAGARVIAFDIALTEPSKPEEDLVLAEAIRRSHAAVILAGFMDATASHHLIATRRVHPLQRFLEAGAVDGDVALPLDEDMVIRRMPMVNDSLWRRVLEAIDWPVSTPPPKATRLIRPLPPGSITRIHYYQALDPATFLAPEAFADKIVLVGWGTQVSSEVDKPGKDMHATPYFWSTGILLSGVEIQASAIDTAYSGTAIAPSGTLLRLGLLVFVALIAYPLLCPWSPLRSTLTLTGGVLGLLVLGCVLFIVGGIWLSITAPGLGLLASYSTQGGLSLLRERHRTRFIRGAFCRYVSADIVNKVLERPERLVLGGERREVSFIITDLTGFTSMTELMEPEQLVDILRRYFDGMCGIVQSHAGTIERLSGDGMVVFFNAPVDQADHAQRAVHCAQALDSFSKRFEDGQIAADIPVGATRIGVNTGWVTVGNYGSNERFHYTAMGDAINTTARLEAANKQFGTRVCISGITKARCSCILFRPVGDVALVGKHRLISVFEPITENTAAADNLHHYLEAYEALKQGEPVAPALFGKLAQACPTDGLVRFHLKRILAGGIGVRIELADK